MVTGLQAEDEPERLELRLVAASFVEFGSSGRVLDKRATVDGWTG